MTPNPSIGQVDASPIEGERGRDGGGGERGGWGGGGGRGEGQEEGRGVGREKSKLCDNIMIFMSLSSCIDKRYQPGITEYSSFALDYETISDSRRLSQSSASSAPLREV